VKIRKAMSQRHPPLRLVVVDDHVFIRDLMVRLLARDFSVLAAVGTTAEALKACGKLRPDVLILDVNLPDGSGIGILPELKRSAPETRVLLCTAYPQNQPISELASSGAHGYVEKTTSWEEFLEAVARVGRGELYFCSHNHAARSSSRAVVERKPVLQAISTLSVREKEVVALLADGLTSKDIASKLHISVATVNSHRSNAMSKLRVRNVAGLVSRAVAGGLTNR
jgi:DNA-binding NarL/FixJ family response regulator